MKESEESSLKIGENVDEFICSLKNFRKSQIGLTVIKNRKTTKEGEKLYREGNFL